MKGCASLHSEQYVRAGSVCGDDRHRMNTPLFHAGRDNVCRPLHMHG
jgi:hypothetical protein